MAKSVFLEEFLQFGDEVREITLAFGEGESAGRQCDAGHRIEPQGGGAVGIENLVFLEKFLDLRFRGAADIPDLEILIGSEAEIALVDFRDLAQTGHELVFIGVENPAVRDEHRVVPLALVILGPSEAIPVVGEGKGFCLLQFETEELVQFLAERVQPHRFDGVLEAGVLAVLAIPVFFLRDDDCLGHGYNLVGFAEADHVGEPGKGRFVPVGHAHAFVRTRADLVVPNVQIITSPVSYDHHEGGATLYRKPAVNLAIGLCRSRARGRVSLRSADPLAPPRIEASLLSHDEDMQDLVEGVRFSRRLFDTKAFGRYFVDERKPGAPAQSDEELRNVIRKESFLMYHPCGSCMMGQGEDSVVDERIR